MGTCKNYNYLLDAETKCYGLQFRSRTFFITLLNVLIFGGLGLFHYGYIMRGKQIDYTSTVETKAGNTPVSASISALRIPWII